MLSSFEMFMTIQIIAIKSSLTPPHPGLQQWQKIEYLKNPQHKHLSHVAP